MPPEIKTALTVGRYLVSIPERTFGIRMGIECFKKTREDIQLSPEEFPTRLFRVYSLFNLSVAGAFGEFVTPNLFTFLRESDLPGQEPKNTPFSRLISQGTGEAFSGTVSLLADLGVDALAYGMYLHGNLEQAVILKLTFNAASHVLVDTLKAGVNNIHHFRNSPIAVF